MGIATVGALDNVSVESLVDCETASAPSSTASIRQRDRRKLLLSVSMRKTRRNT